MKRSKARRKPMQISVEMILKAHGKYEEFDKAEPGEFRLKLEQSAYMPLVIEKVGPDTIAIAHYYRQAGDTIADPEIVFSWCPSEPKFHFCPVEITQPNMMINGRVYGGYRRKFIVKEDGTVLVDRNFDRAVGDLVRVWAKNLRHQGWAEAKAAS